MNMNRKALALILAIGMTSTAGYADSTLLGTAAAASVAPSAALVTMTLTPDGNVPLRSCAEALGYTVSWQPDTRQVVLERTGADTKRLDPGKVSGAVIEQGHWQIPVRFYETDLGLSVTVRNDGKAVIERERFAPDEASTIGEIAEIIQGKDGIQVLVKGQKFGSSGYNEISLALTRTTAVTGGKLEDLKVGTQIYVTYGKSVTKSLPPMGQGIAVEILKEKNLLMGRVLEVITNNATNGNQLRIVGTSDFLVRLSEKTTITDSTGKAVPFSSLKEGMILKAIIAPFATMSMPPQTEVYSIIIQ